MWILLTLVLKTSNPETAIPVYDKPIVYNSIADCQASLKLIYDEHKILQINYPVEVEFKTNENNQKYLVYSYKSDYNKPKITTYYNCLKIYTK